MNILIVDDNPTNLKVLRIMLEAEGMIVFEAADGVEALRVLDREEIAAIISDILMPRMDGYRLCYEVRRSERHKRVPFIFYTSTYTSPSDEQLGLQLGGQVFIRKPAVAAVILQALRQATTTRPRPPAVALEEADVLKEYSERLVAKLEETNIELAVRTESLLEAQKQLLLQSTALETADNAILITDRTGAIQWVNPAFTTLTGYTAADVIGKTPRVLKSGAHDQAFYRELWRTILSGHVWRGEFTNQRKDGTVFHDEHTITPVRSGRGEITHFIGILHDVTARRRAEDELRATHARLSHLLEHSPAVNYALRVEGQNIIPYVVSENITRLLGFTVPETLRYEWWLGQLHPEDRDLAVASISETLSLGVSRTEYRLRDKKEGYHWVEDNRRLIRDSSGQPQEIVGVWMDITGRKRAQESLRESERRFREMQENVQLIAMTLDKNGSVTFCNDYLLRLTGWTREEVLGADWFSKFIPAANPEVRKLFFDTINAGAIPPHHENPIKTRSGELREIVWNNTMLRDEAGNFTGTASLGEDVTKRRRAELRLDAHHAVTQALSEAGTLAETAKKILQIVCQKLHWDVGELWFVDRTSNALRCLEIWHPPSTGFQEFVDASRLMTCARGVPLPGRVWASRQAAWIPDVTRDPNFPRADMAARLGLRTGFASPVQSQGDILGVLVFFCARIRAPDNELLAMFATVGSQIGQFIERKQIEEQFRQSQKMEAFGQLAGGVAHDFNNILAVIMGYTNLLMEEEHLNVEAKDQLKQVYSAGERAANLIRQLLTFSRKKEMQVGPLDLNEVISNITKMLGRVIGEDIKLQCNYASKLPAILADEGMMEQVLMNLAVNARDAMAKGGQLIIGTERVITDVAYVQSNAEARTGEFVCLSVRDTGCGMTPEIKARIFEPFFTTKGVGKGTGLGLATAYGIVKQHQGWLEVESQVGVGTVFKVFLPASARADAGVGVAPVQAKVRGGKETILLVEDEVALRALAKILLQRHGYRVLEAESGVEALSVWEQSASEIDLLLTDMVMPDGVTGRELAKQLQARKPGLKVIYTSGYSLEAGETTFRMREGFTFLQKPYHPQKLLGAVRDCLDRK